MKNHRTSRVLLPLLAVALAAQTLAAGCTATRGRSGAPEASGFLGDYSQLASHPDYEAALIFIRPDVDWSQYDSVYIESAGLWGNEATADLSAEDQQHLTDVMYERLATELGSLFRLTNRPGPRTLILRVALTQAGGAKVALRVVSTVVPQIRAVSSLTGLATDTAATVGNATVEMEVRDSITNRRLAAAVDERAGTKALFATRTFSVWGDVEAACDYWAKRIAWQLARHGVVRKPGAAMPEKPSEKRSI